MKNLNAGIVERGDGIVESIHRLSRDMNEVMHRLREAEKTALTVRVLSAESARGSDTDAEVYALLQAALKLLWALDQPNHEPMNLLELASAVIISPSDMSHAREMVKASLRDSIFCHDI